MFKENLIFQKIKEKIGFLIFVFIALFLFYILFQSRSVSNFGEEKFFKISKGESFLDINQALYKEKLIRSRLAFGFWGYLTGKSLKIQEGTYKLNTNLNIFDILYLLSSGKGREATVVIPPGKTIYEIDFILSSNKILKSKELINYAKQFNLSLEGKLTPDTYNFYYDSTPEEVIKKMLNNFNVKIKPLIEKYHADETSTLILASMIEKEAPYFEDRKIIAGILLKRLKLNMHLNVDATICYIKILQKEEPTPCLPLTPLDLKINSPYNTYVYRGLPPTPISNPGEEAVLAVLTPKETDYLYYLSDLQTKKTIFSKTLEEHNKNILRYLKNNL